MVAGPPVVAASVAAAVGSLALAGYLREYREEPGAAWLLGAIGFQALWSLAYGVALLAFDPGLRWALEVVVWTAMAGEIAFFVAFALDYTGRGRGLPDRWMHGWLLTPIVTLFVSATNPIHRLAWTGFEVVEVGGLAVAEYALRPWALAGATGGVLLALLGSLILFDTVVSYGPLYRREAIAVGLSTLPPAGALLAWLYGVGPEVNLVTVAFLPHIALDAYAFLGSDMFEFNPATRRIGERAAIQDLGSPVVIVDEGRRVVTLNAAAESMLGAGKTSIQTDPLEDYLGGVDPIESDEPVPLQVDGAARTYTTEVTPLDDGRDTDVGYTVVFQDVTEELRREQRLSVLNRVLRHNLRNDMSVVRGFADTARSQVEDESIEGMLETVVEKADELVALGEKAREIDHVLGGDRRPERVALSSLLEDLTTGIAEDGGPTVTVAESDAVLDCGRETLRVTLESLIENAVEYAETTVEIEVVETDGSIRITVADDGPGLPEHERDALSKGEESDLEHGSGLGLWLADWGARRLGGDLSFETDAGTRAVLSIPRTDDR